MNNSVRHLQVIKAVSYCKDCSFLLMLNIKDVGIELKVIEESHNPEDLHTFL